jgi:23S rRNA (uracil1939-C5)-methyltransferase
MPIKKGQILDVDVADLAFGGRGLVKIDGLAVFVDQAIPQDRVRIRVVRKRRNFAEAVLVELLEPSPHRVAAPCPYSGVCGGCKWQFLDYGMQLNYKRRHVAEALKHIGGIDGVAVHPAVSAEQPFHYRNKMEFTCADRRWLLPEEMASTGVEADLAVGLHVPGTFYKVLDTRRCLLQPELGDSLLERFRSFIRSSGEPVYGLRSHRGFWRFLMLRHSAAYDQWMVNIITAAEKPHLLKALAEAFVAEYPQVVSVVNNITARKAAIAVGETEVCLAGSSAIRDRIEGFEFKISANSFFQTNTRGAERLYRTVTNFAGLKGGERVLDLYSGTGTIAICLSGSAREVTGIEVIESAVADAVENCRINRIENCRFVLGDIRERLALIESRPEVMIIDPPRAGMHKEVVRQVLDMAPFRIVYVSCNPATLARDLALMKDRYRIAEVQPVDMFPHTFHIEAVARLERINGKQA